MTVSVRDVLLTTGSAGAIPAGTQAGDLLLACGFVNGANAAPLDPGAPWTVVGSAGSLFTGYKLAWKIADGSASAVSMANADSVTVTALTGHDPATPIGAVATSQSGQDLTVELPTLTQLYPPSFVLTLALHRNATALAPTAASAALTEILDTSGSGTAQVGVYYLAATSAFSGYVIRATGSNSQSRGVAVEIKPAATAPSTVTASLAGTLPALAGALSASDPVDSTLTGQLPAPVGAITADDPVTAHLAGVLPTLDGTFTADTPVTAALTGVLPDLIAALAADQQDGVTAVLDGVLPALQAHMAADTPNEAVLDGVLPALTGALSVQDPVEAVLAGTLPDLAAMLTAVILAARVSLAAGPPEPLAYAAGPAEPTRLTAGAAE